MDAGPDEPADTLTSTRDLLSKLLQIPKDEVAKMEREPILLKTLPRQQVSDFRPISNIKVRETP